MAGPGEQDGRPVKALHHAGRGNAYDALVPVRLVEHNAAAFAFVIREQRPGFLRRALVEIAAQLVAVLQHAGVFGCYVTVLRQHELYGVVGVGQAAGSVDHGRQSENDIADAEGPGAAAFFNKRVEAGALAAIEPLQAVPG